MEETPGRGTVSDTPTSYPSYSRVTVTGQEVGFQTDRGGLEGEVRISQLIADPVFTQTRMGAVGRLQRGSDRCGPCRECLALTAVSGQRAAVAGGPAGKK